MKKGSKKLSPYLLFFIIVGAAELLTLLLAFITRGNALNDLLFHDRHDTFMDYFHPLMAFDHYSLAELYEDAKVFYPPLSMLFYLMMHSLIPSGVEISDDFEARTLQITLFPYVIYLLVTTLALVYLISQYKQGEKKDKLLMTALAVFSYPMLYQYDRSNIIILALLFTLAFVYLKDSTSKLWREVALICLAIAAGIKVYPALFGLLLIIEKRYKEAIRCVIYGLAAFILPAFIFGGVNPLDMILSLCNMSSGVATEGFGYKVNFANTFAMLARVTGIAISSAALTAIVLTLGALCIVAVFLQKQNWKRLCLISIFIAGVPGVSYAYVMMFMLIPAVAFLNEINEQPRCALNFVYAVWLALCLAPLPFTNTRYDSYGYPVTVTVLTESIALIVLLIILFSDGIISAVRAKKQTDTSQPKGA